MMLIIRVGGWVLLSFDHSPLFAVFIVVMVILRFFVVTVFIARFREGIKDTSRSIDGMIRVALFRSRLSTIAACRVRIFRVFFGSFNETGIL